MPRSPILNLPSTSIVLADCVARGHVSAGLHCHQAVKQIYEDASSSVKIVDVSAVLSLAIPAISNLALGLEIFLKMHHFQNSGVYPTGHDLGELATSFEPETQSRLNSSFKEMLANDQVISGATLKISVGEQQEDFGANWPEEAIDLPSAAISLGRAYERWRYIYEELQKPLIATISFKPLLALIFTMDLAIQSFRSSSYVSIQ